MSPETAVRGGFDFEQLSPPAPRPPAQRLDDVHARSAAIVAAAEAEAERIREAARASGYEQGLRDGRELVLAELTPAAGALVAVLDGLRAESLAVAEKVEHEAVLLALRIAEKVVAGAIEVQPERVIDVVRGALRAVVERERLVIQVHPADLELVRAATDELSTTLGGIAHLEVQEERRVERGGAIVRTTVGEVDASIQTKLERARTALEAELRA